jgi:two-component system response regulator YesN
MLQSLPPLCVLRAVAYMEGHLARQDLTLNLVAHEIGCSRGHLSRQCRRYLAGGFRAQRSAMRIAEAKRLLVAGDSPAIKTIAFDVGYSHHSTFCREFKRSEGVSPAVWRRGACVDNARAHAVAGS